MDIMDHEYEVIGSWSIRVGSDDLKVIGTDTDRTATCGLRRRNAIVKLLVELRSDRLIWNDLISQGDTWGTGVFLRG